MGDVHVPGASRGIILGLTLELTLTLCLSAQVFPVGVSPCLSDYMLNETNQAIQGLVNNNLNVNR